LPKKFLLGNAAASPAHTSQVRDPVGRYIPSSYDTGSWPCWEVYKHCLAKKRLIRKLTKALKHLKRPINFLECYYYLTFIFHF